MLIFLLMRLSRLTKHESVIFECVNLDVDFMIDLNRQNQYEK